MTQANMKYLDKVSPLIFFLEHQNVSRNSSKRLSGRDCLMCQLTVFSSSSQDYVERGMVGENRTRVNSETLI